MEANAGPLACQECMVQIQSPWSEKQEITQYEKD